MPLKHGIGVRIPARQPTNDYFKEFILSNNLSL